MKKNKRLFHCKNLNTQCHIVSLPEEVHKIRVGAPAKKKNPNQAKMCALPKFDCILAQAVFGDAHTTEEIDDHIRRIPRIAKVTRDCTKEELSLDAIQKACTK